MKKNSRFITKYTSLEDPTHLPPLDIKVERLAKNNEETHQIKVYWVSWQQITDWQLTFRLQFNPHSFTYFCQFLVPMHSVGFLSKIWPFLLCFSRQNWRVIFEVFQSNFGFAWLNSTVRSLGCENEWKNWEMFTSSLRSHKFKSGNISGKIWQCAATTVLLW